MYMEFISWFWLLCIVIGVVYSILIIWFINGWKLIPVFKKEQEVYNTKVSVLVPFYNESLVLEKCIKSLLLQKISTSKFEIILIDDYSEDDSVSVVKQYIDKYEEVRFISNYRDKGKKNALLCGVNESVGDMVVTTDADCLYSKSWLANLVEYYEKYNPNMLIGPVALNKGVSLLHKFQEFEFITLVASGAGAVGINHPIMCNGANIAFNKEVFNEIDDPFNINYESGDDVFLLHNMKKKGVDKIHFIKSKEVIVTTIAKANIKDFFKQRFRWISKAPGYNDADTKFSAFVIFLVSFLWVVGLITTIFYNNIFLQPTLFLFLLKTVIDIFFYKEVSSFFDKKQLLKYIFIFQILYGIYVSITGVVLFIKGRR